LYRKNFSDYSTYQALTRKRDRFRSTGNLEQTDEEDQLLAGGIFQIFVGLVAIVSGFTAGAFYPAFMRRPRPDEKPMPKWLGRTIFTVVGPGFMYSGLSDWLLIQRGATAKGIFWILVGLAGVTFDLIAGRIYHDPTTNQRARWAGRILTFIFAVGVISLGVSYITRRP
jgi:hypothetical protein